MIDRSIFLGPINARSVPIFCGNTYSNVINAEFKLATIAEEIGFSQSGCRYILLTHSPNCSAKAFCMTSTVAIESVQFYIT